MVYVIVYVKLFRFINELFNFAINNVVGKPIIDKGLFNVFKFVKEGSSRGGEKHSSGNTCFYYCSFFLIFRIPWQYSIFVDSVLFFEIHQQLSFIQLCVCVFLLCYKSPKNFQNSLKKKHSLHMQADDGLWRVRKRSGQFW